jgi:hypothetical protein
MRILLVTEAMGPKLIKYWLPLKARILGMKRLNGSGPLIVVA